MTRFLSLSVAAVAGLSLMFGTLGCESATSPSNSQSAPKKPAMTEEEKEIAAELAKLPPKDRELAEKQKICPVTDEPLGSMGKPEKLTVEGKEVFICCDGCKDAVMKEPAKYLAKIGK